MRAPWDPIHVVQALFDPATAIAGAGLAMQAIGTLTSAGAQRAQGAASNQAAKIQAAGAQWNAQVKADIGRYRADMLDWSSEVNERFANSRADRVITEARAQQDIIARGTSRMIGRAQAAYAAGGVTMEGTPLSELQDIATEGNLQEALTIYGGTVTAGDIRAQARFDALQSDAQSNILRAVASQDQTNGNIAAANLFAGGAAAESAANAGADATLFTGAAKTLMGGYNLFTANGPSSGASSNPNLSGFAVGGGPQGPSGGAVSF